MIYIENEYKKYNKDRFYGAYIHYLRREYEVAQKDLAKSVHVSNSTLSKMESGQQNMDLETFYRAIWYFEEHYPDYSFNREISKLEEAEHLIDHCLQKFIDLSYFDDLTEIKQYLDKKENKNSFAYFHYRIIEMFYKLFNKKGTMKEVEEIIETDYFLHGYYLAILYDFYGIIEKSIDLSKIPIKIESLKKAHSYAQQIRNVSFMGLIEYHLSYHYEDLQDPISAYEMIKQSEDNLQRSASYRRLATIQMNEANLLLKFKIYTKANIIFQSLVNKKDQIQNSRIQNSIYDNLAWCEFMQEHDEQALIYALKGQKAGSSFPDLYIVLVFSNYRLGHFELSRHFALEFIKKDSEDERSLFIKLFMELIIQILGNGKNIFKIIERIEKKLSFFKAVELEIPFYSLLVDYFKTNSDFEHALKYNELLVQYLKFDYNFH